MRTIPPIAILLTASSLLADNDREFHDAAAAFHELLQQKNATAQVTLTPCHEFTLIKKAVLSVLPEMEAEIRATEHFTAGAVQRVFAGDNQFRESLRAYSDLATGSQTVTSLQAALAEVDFSILKSKSVNISETEHCGLC